MAQRIVLVQVVTIQRAEHPTGLRIWSDGTVQRGIGELPGPTELLEKDRALDWTDIHTLNDDQLDTVRSIIRQSGIFDLEPRLLINYCKEDPGVAIWTVSLDGQTARVVVYDPRPRRSPQLDRLMQVINGVLA
jgi:hypothetical protein